MPSSSVPADTSCTMDTSRPRHMRSTRMRRCVAALAASSTSNSTTVSAPRTLAHDRPAPMPASSSPPDAWGTTAVPASSRPAVQASATVYRASRLNRSMARWCMTPGTGTAAPAPGHGTGWSRRRCSTCIASSSSCTSGTASGREVSTTTRRPSAAASRSSVRSTASLDDTASSSDGRRGRTCANACSIARRSSAACTCGAANAAPTGAAWPAGSGTACGSAGLAAGLG